jgi:hypothetical protein
VAVGAKDVVGVDLPIVGERERDLGAHVGDLDLGHDQGQVLDGASPAGGAVADEAR